MTVQELVDKLWESSPNFIVRVKDMYDLKYHDIKEIFIKEDDDLEIVLISFKYG